MEEWQCSEVIGDGQGQSDKAEITPAAAVSSTNLDAAGGAK